MPNSEFKPKLGRIRDGGRSKSQWNASRVLEQAGESGARSSQHLRNTPQLRLPRCPAAGVRLHPDLLTPTEGRTDNILTAVGIE